MYYPRVQLHALWLFLVRGYVRVIGLALEDVLTYGTDLSHIYPGA
jgi:hypothetical protein